MLEFGIDPDDEGETSRVVDLVFREVRNVAAMSCQVRSVCHFRCGVRCG